MKRMFLVMLASLALVGQASAADWSPEYDDLPKSVRTMLDKYAERCFFYKGDIWYADADALAKRDANVKPMKGRSVIRDSNLTDDPRPFRDEQARPPVVYNINDGDFVCLPEDDLAAAQAEQKVTEGVDLLTVTGAGDTKVKRPTGEDLYKLIASGTTLPRFVAEKVVHDKALYELRTFRSGNSQYTKKVLVKPATYKAAWVRSEHPASQAASRVVDLLRRKREIAAKRLIVLEKNLTDSLREDLTRTDDAERLILLYLFEAGSPDQAEPYLPIVDASFAEHAKLAAKPLRTLTPAESLKLADWCFALSEDDRYRSVDPLTTRAARGYERFLSSNPAPPDGEDKTRAEERLQKLGD